MDKDVIYTDSTSAATAVTVLPSRLTQRSHRHLFTHPTPSWR